MLYSLRSAAIGLLAVSSIVNALPQPQTDSSSSDDSNTNSSSACNNSPELCSRTYNNVTHMGAHGSSFLREAATFASAGNQNLNATDALDAGIRLLQAQVHKENGTLRLCHTTCDILDAGPLKDWLSKINYWMDNNPDEVVTLLLVNSDKAPASEFGQAFNSSGLADLAFTPTGEAPLAEWPTLQTMINNDQRLVSFVTNINATDEYSYLMPEFKYVFETSFEVPELQGFNCTVDRPSKLEGDGASAISSNYLGLVNHFKYQSLGGDLFVPDISNIEVVNSADTSEDGNLGLHLQECQQQWGTAPNFALVDLIEKGDVLKAADRMNGISDAKGRTAMADTEDDDSAGAVPDRRTGMVALVAFVAASMMII